MLDTDSKLLIMNKTKRSSQLPTTYIITIISPGVKAAVKAT